MSISNKYKLFTVLFCALPEFLGCNDPSQIKHFEKKAQDAQLLLNGEQEDHKKTQSELTKARKRLEELEKKDGDKPTTSDELNKLKDELTKAKKDLEEAQAKNYENLTQHRQILAEKNQHAEMLQKKVDDFNKKELENKAAGEALDEASKLLDGSINAAGFVKYYQRLFKDDKDKANQAIREIFQRLLHKKEHPVAFCAEHIINLKKLKLNDATKSCISQLLQVCIDKSKDGYGKNYAKALHDLSVRDKSGYSIDDLSQFLKGNHKDQEGKVWGSDRVLLQGVKGKHWIVSSPKYQDAARLSIDPKNHSKHFIDTWVNAIKSAEHYVDITTLSLPEDDFMEALKEGLKALDQKDKEIIVRIMLGANTITFQTFDVWEEIKTFTKDLRNNSKLKISLGSYNASYSPLKGKILSWNHSKIVAVDGKLLFTGGHNLYSGKGKNGDLGYLHPDNPLHDLSLLVSGKLAVVGHEFCSKLWNYIAKAWSNSFCKLSTFSTKDGQIIYDTQNQPVIFDKDKHLVNFDNPPEGAETVLALGRLANVGERLDNVSDNAMIQMINNANRAIFISQQALLQPALHESLQSQFTKNILSALFDKLKEGIDVFLLTSSTNAQYVGDGTLSYSSGYSQAALMNHFIDLDKSKDQDRQIIIESLIKHLHVLPTANRNHEVPNHSKVLIADDIAYVGSHNLYDDSHAEFGVGLGARASQELLNDYFSALWFTSLELGTEAPKALELNDYKNGDFVFVRRSRNDDDQQNSSQDWTMGRIFFANQNLNLVGVDLDFLNRDRSSNNRSYLINEKLRLTRINIPRDELSTDGLTKKWETYVTDLANKIFNGSNIN